MLSLSNASLKIAFGSIGSCTPFQSTWDVSCPCAIEPSLAAKLIVVVKVALPFVWFWLSLPHSVKWPLQSTGLAEVDRAGLGEGRPELVPSGEEGDVLDEIAVD